MSEVLQRVRGLVERAKGLRRMCPDGPLWDEVAGLQLELVELEGAVREKDAEGSTGAGCRMAQPDRRMRAAGDHSFEEETQP